MFRIKKKLNNEIISEQINTIFCGFEIIILSNEFVGINPPVDIRLILKFKELNILTSVKLSMIKITKLKIVYKINIFVNSSLTLDSKLILPSPEKVKSFIL